LRRVRDKDNTKEKREFLLQDIPARGIFVPNHTMAFIDEITIYAKAGNGGDGVVRWLHEKGKEFGGPSGGNGGRGGNVYAVAFRDVHLLSRYKTKKELLAGRGEDGGKDSAHGGDGADLDVPLPVGSIITNTKTRHKVFLTREGELVLLSEGGRGGRGNESYKSSVNRSPEEFTRGGAGEDGEFFIEVELIADIGFIGLPNAGKTSLLNALTNARGKVGDYPFTTLEPNLGEMYGYIIADIPGLIEGAAEGKGLGHKFLRHVRRTKILVHLVSLENEEVTTAYKTVRAELARYDKALVEKKEIVLLTKTDLIEDKETIKTRVAEMKKSAEFVTSLSILDDAEVRAFRDFLIKEVRVAIAGEETREGARSRAEEADSV